MEVEGKTSIGFSRGTESNAVVYGLRQKVACPARVWKRTVMFSAANLENVDSMADLLIINVEL